MSPVYINILAGLGLTLLVFLAYFGAKVLMLGLKFSVDIYMLEVSQRRLRNAKTNAEADAVIEHINKKANE